MVLYSFYKNVVLTLVLFFFAFHSGCSGQSIFEDNVYSSCNIILALPVESFGVLNIDMSSDTLLQHKWLCLSSRAGGRQNLSFRRVISEMIQAFLDDGRCSDRLFFSSRCAVTEIRCR